MFDVMAAGLSGIQQGTEKLNQAANQIVNQQAGGLEQPSDTSSGNATSNDSSGNSDGQASNGQSFGGQPGQAAVSSTNSASNGSLAENVVALKSAEQQVSASAQVVESAEKTLGTLLDVEA